MLAINNTESMNKMIFTLFFIFTFIKELVFISTTAAVKLS